LQGSGAKGKVVGEGVRALLINDNSHSFWRLSWYCLKIIAIAFQKHWNCTPISSLLCT